MSIVIHGVDMPTDSPLWVVVHSDGTVETNDVNGGWPFGWQTLQNAAIPIPPHGRLGDLDALWDRLKNIKSVLGFGTAKAYQIYDMGFLAGFRAAVKIALEMPTIIPASRQRRVNEADDRE